MRYLNLRKHFINKNIVHTTYGTYITLSGLKLTFGFLALLANPEVNVLVTSLVAVLGSDPTEQTCEQECVVLMHADSVIHHLCPFVCHS